MECFYWLSSSGISNEDFIKKYIHTEEFEETDPDTGKIIEKIYFELDLSNETSIISGVASAIYYMLKFNSILTITEYIDKPSP